MRKGSRTDGHAVSDSCSVAGVRHLGDKIVAQRPACGPYSSIGDLTPQVQLKKTAADALAIAGSFASYGSFLRLLGVPGDLHHADHHPEQADRRSSREPSRCGRPRSQRSSAASRSTARPRQVDAHQDTARKIAALLGHHPLALSIIGRHLHDHLNWAITDYLEPMTTLAMEGGLRAAPAMSDRGLPAESQRLSRLLTMHPGHDFDAPAAAAMANLTITSAQHHLGTLLSAHLLERTQPQPPGALNATPWPRFALEPARRRRSSSSSNWT